MRQSGQGELGQERTEQWKLKLGEVEQGELKQREIESEEMEKGKSKQEKIRQEKFGQKKKPGKGLTEVLFNVIKTHRLLCFGIFSAIMCVVVTALLPPLILERTVNLLTEGSAVPLTLAVMYFVLIFLTDIMNSVKESMLIIFGQKMTHGLRNALCNKLNKLSADTFVKHEPGSVVSRFVGDVDTVESLFTSGVVSMFADACKVISIFAILFVKNKGLAFVLLLLVPLLFAFTRTVQKRMLSAQIANRVAIGKVTNHVPETIRCIRTIHLLGKERYMRDTYDKHIQDSFNAVEKVNFYDSVYSPIILIVNAVVVAVIMLLSATGSVKIQSFFGMSVGTAVAVISYIGSIFGPLESIGMEIQTIQSAVAGVRRIDEFLALPEHIRTDENIGLDEMLSKDCACVEFKDVTFGYDSASPVLKSLNFTINTGEQITLTGRTGAGKSTIFKLLLGQYAADSGEVLICGYDAALLPDSIKRRFFGYVEQNFHMIPGTIMEQITLSDTSISEEMARKAAMTVGLHDFIEKLERGYDTPCAPSIFSQGQWQLLSIARAIASEPKLLLLDEITANLDADTEQTVLSALKRAAKNRTVISISHRLYRENGGRQIAL